MENLLFEKCSQIRDFLVLQPTFFFITDLRYKSKVAISFLETIKKINNILVPTVYRLTKTQSNSFYS